MKSQSTLNALICQIDKVFKEMTVIFNDLKSQRLSLIGQYK